MDVFTYESRSATGLVRLDNEDSICLHPERGFFAVADGMGGGAEGARASKMTCAAIERGVVAEHFPDRLDQIRAALEAANAEVGDYARANRFRQMGTTVALLVFETDSFGRAAIAYVGDSRVYRFRAGAAELLTRDHSIGAELEEKVGGHLGGQFAARTNPLAHVLTRAIGAEATVEIEWRKIDVEPRDRFLVCTDGVHDLIQTDELANLVASTPLKAAAKCLEDAILARGAHDNYSFILIEREA